MARTIGVRAQIALLFYTTVNIVIFTAAVYAVAMFPTLTPHAGFWLALIMGASLIVTAPLAWCLGGCLMPAAWRKNFLAEPSPRASEPTRSV
jgi:hypothetical protein